MDINTCEKGVSGEETVEGLQRKTAKFASRPLATAPRDLTHHRNFRCSLVRS